MLVLYGTERNPQQPVTSTTTTTTTTQQPTTPKKRHRKHNINSPSVTSESPYYRSDTNNITSFIHPPPLPETPKSRHSHGYKEGSYYKEQYTPKPKPEAPKPSSQSQVQYIYQPQTRKPYPPHAKNEVHMCIFETLAKRSNLSTRQYYQMMKKDLTSGKKMSCDHVI